MNTLFNFKTTIKKFMGTGKLAIMLLCIFIYHAATFGGTTAELWPADRKTNKTQYCYGNDWNALRFVLYGNGIKGAVPVDLQQPISRDLRLEVIMPAEVKYQGAVILWFDKSVKTDQHTEIISEGGADLLKISIPLGKDFLSQRLDKSKSEYNVLVWYLPPEKLNGKLCWSLYDDEKLLGHSELRLVTAGVVKDGTKLPKRFGFYPYGWYGVVPDDDFDHMADFYRRFGITALEIHCDYGLPDEKFAKHQKMLQANRRHGVKNIALLDHMYNKFAGKLHNGHKSKTPANLGLSGAMDKACAGIESNEAKKYWKQVCGFFDYAQYDWEPDGPVTWPGYDDEPTIAAFAKAKNITEKLDAESLKTKYRDAYARFRMEQAARAPLALKRTIDAVKSVPFFVEQGDGSRRNVDYNTFASKVEFVRPMTYLHSPLAYARDIILMLKSTDVPAKKFTPDLTIGWQGGNLLRRTPEEYLLDTVVTAAAGCGGVAHWPGIHQADASWFGIHEGLRRIALVEDFYFEGKTVNNITVSGIPYRVKQINVGRKSIKLSAPEWGASLISFTHKLNNEYLFTILNYDEYENAYVGISSPELANLHLVDPVNGVYINCDQRGSTVVCTPREAPLMLIATSDSKRIEGRKLIDSDVIRKDFDAAKKNFLKKNREDAVSLGKVGNIAINYAETKFGGNSHVCLEVKTPDQTVSFGNSGGRIYTWDVTGIKSLVGNKAYANCGIGMDLLWLPKLSRWSGDEISDMKLVECRNDGKNVTLIYEGEFRKGYPGVIISKKYIIHSIGTSIDMEVTLRNELSRPVTISYWQHNVFNRISGHLITNNFRFDKEGNSLFISGQCSKDMEALISELGKTNGEIGKIFAEYFPEDKSGLIFRLPDNFMNVYRWSSPKSGMRSCEWMSRPLDIPAGMSTTIRFSLTAVPNTTPESLNDLIKK